MIWGSFHVGDSHCESTFITKDLLLLTLSVVTSMDALVVGFTFTFLEVDIVLTCSIMGVDAFMARRLVSY